MAIIETDRTINNLINITSTGINTASYVEVKDVLVKQYKNIYGSDIDLANNTADGIYIENLSLIISKILQCFNFLYSNLNINTAQNTYLESLCALTNIYRRSATKSIAYLDITNNEDSNITLSKTLNLSFVDNSGLEWTTLVGDINYGRASDSIILKPNETQTIPVYCKTYGPIQAKIGWINKLLTNDYDISFTQVTDAELGTNIETDSELKLRRDESFTSIGTTVVQSLTGNLLSIYGINEVKIYNNNTNDDIIAEDNTIVNCGGIYIIINTIKNIDDSIIGNVIYNKMTPGIKTIQSSNIAGINHQYIVEQDENNFLLTNYVNWKQTTKITSDVSIQLNIVSNTTFDITSMIDNLTKYLNNLSIGQVFYDYEVLNYLSTTDIENNLVQTYIPKSFKFISGNDINIDNINAKYNSKDTSFNLSTSPKITQTTENYVTTITLTW